MAADGAQDKARGRYYSLTSPHEQFDPVCRFDPAEHQVAIDASRDGELPRRKTNAGCPTCGCPTWGKH